MNVRLAAALVFLASSVSPSFATRYHVNDVDKLVRILRPRDLPRRQVDRRPRWPRQPGRRPHRQRVGPYRCGDPLPAVLSRKAHAGFPRWSPDGATLAFLAEDDKKHLQIWTLSISQGGDSEQLTQSPTSIEQIAWRPDGHALAFVAEDDTPERKGRDKFADAFEVGSNDFLARSRQMPAHLWVIDLPASDRKPQAKRLTSAPGRFPSAFAGGAGLARAMVAGWKVDLLRQSPHAALRRRPPEHHPGPRRGNRPLQALYRRSQPRICSSRFARWLADRLPAQPRRQKLERAGCFPRSRLRQSQ